MTTVRRAEDQTHELHPQQVAEPPLSGGCYSCPIQAHFVVQGMELSKESIFAVALERSVEENET